MNSLQNRVQQLLDCLVSEDKERGLQAAVYHRGELIVDACAGWTDDSCTVPVDAHTLFPVFSVSKGIASTIVHRLVERGQLDYDTPIARYWPEFGCLGKETISLGQALSHSSGIPQVPAGLRLPDFGDWEKVCAAIAGLEPLWKPGSKVEYHAINFGWIVGEAACRVTGSDFPTLLEEEIKAPLGLQDLFIGLPENHRASIAVLEEIGPVQEFPPHDAPSAIPWWTQPLYEMMNRPDMQRACIPATSGLMSARAIAKHYAALAQGGVKGVQLLAPETLSKATLPQLLPDGTVSPFGLGYALGGGNPARGNRNTVFGHAGHGGTEGFYDPELDLAIGFTRNRLRDPSETPTSTLVADLVREHHDE